MIKGFSFRCIKNWYCWCLDDLSYRRNGNDYLIFLQSQIICSSHMHTKHHWFPTSRHGVIANLLPEASFGLQVMSLPACFRVSVNHELVCAITCHKFELESPNLDQKCKIFCLRSSSFLGLIRLPGQILLYLEIMFICIAFASFKYCETCRSNCSISHRAPHT